VLINDFKDVSTVYLSILHADTPVSYATRKSITAQPSLALTMELASAVTVDTHVTVHQDLRDLIVKLMCVICLLCACK